jgi:hypothetical protein
MCILVCGCTDPKTPCPTRAPNTLSTPPHKSTPSALLYARLPAPPPPPPPRASLSPCHPLPHRRRAPPCPRAVARLSVSAPPAGRADPILPSSIVTAGAGVRGGSGDPLHHKMLLTPPPSIPPGSLVTPDAA